MGFGYTHIADGHGAHNMIETLEGKYKSKGYTSREVLQQRSISRAGLADHESVTKYLNKYVNIIDIEKAKIKPAELGHNRTWRKIHPVLSSMNIPSSYELVLETVLSSRGQDSAGKLPAPDSDEIIVKYLT